jgi:hypothetical protein
LHAIALIDGNGELCKQWLASVAAGSVVPKLKDGEQAEWERFVARIRTTASSKWQQEEMEYLARLSRQQRARAGGKAGGRGRGKADNSSVITLAAELSRDRSKDVHTLAAGRCGVSERKIRTAQQLKVQSPRLYKRVLAGGEPLAVAKRAAERHTKRREQRRNAKRAKRLMRKQLWEVHCGDCIEEMRKLKAGTVRLIFADPPYNQGIDYGRGAKADRLPDAKYLAWCRNWIRGCVRLLTDDGSLGTINGDTQLYHKIDQSVNWDMAGVWNASSQGTPCMSSSE